MMEKKEITLKKEIDSLYKLLVKSKYQLKKEF
jgi:hypothetical protein